jgi:hypothetical protein
MLTDRDFARCAMVLIKRYGPQAAYRADLRAEQLTDQGREDVAAIWREVTHTIRRIQSGARAA